MHVFVLMGGINYEGDVLLGVYTSEYEAVNAYGVYTRKQQDFNYFYIERVVMDAPANICNGYRIVL